MSSAEELSPEQFRDAQAAEYGEYVAVNAISIDGVRAFNAGDPVPKSHVDHKIVSKDDVTKVGKTASGSGS